MDLLRPMDDRGGWQERKLRNFMQSQYDLMIVQEKVEVDKNTFTDKNSYKSHKRTIASKKKKENWLLKIILKLNNKA